MASSCLALVNSSRRNCIKIHGFRRSGRRSKVLQTIHFDPSFRAPLRGNASLARVMGSRSLIDGVSVIVVGPCRCQSRQHSSSRFSLASALFLDSLLPRSLPMNSPDSCALGRTGWRLFLDPGLEDGNNPPVAPVSRTDAGECGYSALCVTTGLSRDGDRLDPPSYCVGNGLSCKPMAAAFRFSDFKMLAFTLASYSAIDCVTYSWPYLSIR